MRKILFVINSLAGGGAQKLIKDLLVEFARQNTECAVLIISEANDKYKSRIEAAGINVDIVPRECRNHLQKIFFIRKYIKESGVQIVHANLFPTFYYCSIAKMMSRIDFPALVMTEHSTHNRRRNYKCFRLLERIIYNEYDKVISISEQTEKSLEKWIKPKQKSNFITINNGIPLKQFEEAEPFKREDLLDRVTIHDRLLGMIGSFTDQKNHLLLIEAMKQLPDNYKLILCGEGPLLNTIKSIVVENQLGNRVFFMGFRKDIERIIKTVDIMVVPSKWEGFGLVAVEAMACGKPVIVANVPGLTEVVGEAGLKIPPDNKKALCDAILSLEDESKYNYLCEKSRLQSQKYDIKETARKYLETFSEVLENRNTYR